MNRNLVIAHLKLTTILSCSPIVEVGCESTCNLTNYFHIIKTTLESCAGRGEVTITAGDQSTPAQSTKQPDAEGYGAPVANWLGSKLRNE